MADKKDEGKETQEKETKKTEEKEPELVSHNESCNVTVLVYQMINDGVFFHCIFIELNSNLPCHALKKRSENVFFDIAKMFLKEIRYFLSHGKIRFGIFSCKVYLSKA